MSSFLEQIRVVDLAPFSDALSRCCMYTFSRVIWFLVATSTGTVDGLVHASPIPLIPLNHLKVPMNSDMLI